MMLEKHAFIELHCVSQYDSCVEGEFFEKPFVVNVKSCSRKFIDSLTCPNDFTELVEDWNAENGFSAVVVLDINLSIEQFFIVSVFYVHEGLSSDYMANDTCGHWDSDWFDSLSDFRPELACVLVQHEY